MKHWFNWFMGVFLYHLSTPFYKISNFFVDIGYFLYCQSLRFEDANEEKIFLGSGCVFCDLSLEPDEKGWHEGTDKHEKVRCPNYIVENCPQCGNWEAQDKYGKCFTHR